MNCSFPVGALLRKGCIFGALLSFGMLWGCGGGVGGGETPPPPSGDFSLSISPTSISIPAGGSATISVSASALNGFSSSVSVQIGGLPAGVSASPATLALAPGTTQQIILSAASGTPQGTAMVAFIGTSGALEHQANLSLGLIQGGNGVLPTRTKYVRTDAVIEYYQWVNSHWTVYHPGTNRFFVTDPFSNQVFVMDAGSRSEIASIEVPGAYGIDQAPDGSALYVGTLIGDVYVIDPLAMAVKQRYIASQIGPYGFQAINALVLSDGRLALLGEQGGIPNVDGSSSLAIWSPNDNSITIYGAAPATVPASPLCGNTSGHLFEFALTSDRTALIINGTVQGTDALCELNVATGQWATTNPAGTGGFIVSPDGKYIAIPIFPNAVELIDQKTLQQVTQFNVSSDNLSGAAVIFNPDSKTLFVSGSSFVNAYDVATGQFLGWVSNIVVSYTSGGLGGAPMNPNYGAFDTTGLMVGPLEEGFGFLDTTQLQTGSHGSGFLNAVLDPATGPVGGGTVTQWSAPTPSQIYFGKNLASFEPAQGSLIPVMTPSGQPGPADAYLFLSDGEMQLVPEGFSYGPTILEVSPNYSTAEGNGAGVIYGYGFGPLNATTLPSGLSVTLGGKQATITGFNPNTYGESSPAPPFPLQSIYYTIPAGTSGNAADVTVTSSSGTTTAKGAMTYLPALKQYPLTGSSLAQGIYDPTREVYYFTDSNKIQVFSLQQGAWLNPIAIPAPQGATQRLWGIALSPDDSKLAVSDVGAAVIYLVDPANPSSVQTFSMNGAPIVPVGIAIGNSGVAYLAVDCQCGFGYGNFYELDTSTGVLTNLDPSNIGSGTTNRQARAVISADSSRVYFNVLGDVVGFETSTGAKFSASVTQLCCQDDDDLTLAPNQLQLEASAYLYDSNLNGESTFVLNDREIQDISYVYGTKFNPDASLLFQPATQGMDIYDGRLGILRSRVAFSVPLSTNYDALVSDGTDNILIALTGTSGDGIALVDLSSISEPTALPYVRAANRGGETSQTVGHEGWATAPSNNTSASAPGVRRVPHVTNPAWHLPK